MGDLSAEIKAVRIIQVAWRRRLAIKREQELKAKTAAVVVIQQWWRQVRCKLQKQRYTQAATVLQAIWRKKLAQRELKKLKEKKHHEKQNQAAFIIQSVFRHFWIRRTMLKSSAARTIQSAWRAYRQRKEYITTRNS